MKSGFDFILYFVLLPLTVAFELFWLWLDEKVFKKLLYFFWMPTCAIAFIFLMFRLFSVEKNTDSIRQALNGMYVVDRARFAGPQADWQYNHYRFEITPDDSLFLYVTVHERVVKTIKTAFTYHLTNNNPKITLQTPTPQHHLFRKRPILIQEGNSFYYVFFSKKYGNIFFTKGEWEAIDKVAKE